MKKLFLIIVLFLLVVLIGCKQIDSKTGLNQESLIISDVPEDTSTEEADVEEISEEVDVEEGLEDLEDLDDLELNDDFNFDELDDLELE